MIANYFKKLLGILRKIIFSKASCIWVLFAVKGFKHLVEYTEFSIKILIFSGAPESYPPAKIQIKYTESNALLTLALGGGERRILRKEMKAERKPK